MSDLEKTMKSLIEDWMLYSANLSHRTFAKTWREIEKLVKHSKGYGDMVSAAMKIRELMKDKDFKKEIDLKGSRFKEWDKLTKYHKEMEKVMKTASNKKIASELLKLAKHLTAKETVDQKHLDKMKKMTDRNDHNGALIYLYDEVLKNKKGANALRAIDSLTDYFGHMPKELSDLRYREFYKKGMNLVEQVFEKEDSEKIYKCF